MDKYSIPVSIIIAGVFVAGAVILSNFHNFGKGDSLANVSDAVDVEEENTMYLNALPISDSDHIFGDKNAKIKIVTYADMECPYCISFEGTMRTVVAEYGGQVAWVYRHFPLDESTVPVAIASECLADLEGEEKFWSFMEKFSSDMIEGEDIDVKDMAVSLGANSSEFSDCYDSERFLEKIDGNYNDGMVSGLQGTPYSVIFADGTPVDVIDGAYPIEDVKAAIDQYLK